MHLSMITEHFYQNEIAPPPSPRLSQHLNDMRVALQLLIILDNKKMQKIKKSALPFAKFECCCLKKIYGSV